MGYTREERLNIADGEEAGGAASGGGEGSERAEGEGAWGGCGELAGGAAEAGRGEDFRV